MIKFKNIIIDRLKDIFLIKKELQQSIKITNSQTTKDAFFKHQKIISKYKLLQINRMNFQLKFLKDLNYSQNSIKIQQITSTIINIIDYYDKDFLPPLNIRAQIIGEDQLRDIFIKFMTKYQIKKQKYLVDYLKNFNNRINNSNYINWINDWSKQILQNVFNQDDKKSQSKHQSQNISKLAFNDQIPIKKANNSQTKTMTNFNILQCKKTKDSFYTSMPRKLKTQSFQNIEDKIYYFNRQHFYSFMKTQLSYYYSKFDCIDIDLQYLPKIGKNVRKIDYLNEFNILNAVSFIVKNCNAVINDKISSFRGIMQQRQRQISKGMKIKKLLREFDQKRQTSLHEKKYRESKRLFNMNNNFITERQSLKFHVVNNLLTITSTQKSIQPKQKEKQREDNFQGKINNNPENLNFVKRTQRERDRRNRRQMFKNLNYTTLVYNEPKSNLYLTKSPKKQLSVKPQYDSVQYLANKFDKTEVNYSSKIFIMDCQKQKQIKTIRMQCQYKKLKAKNYSIKLQRFQALRNSHYKSYSKK